MRRSLTWAAAALVAAAAAVAGCSGPSAPLPAPGRSVPPIGDPSDVASPVDTTAPTPTLRAAVQTMGPPPPVAPNAAARPATIDPASAPLAACLNGNWSAPVAREFGSLGLSRRSLGAARGGTGLMRLTLGKDQNFAFTYDRVALDLAAGQVLLNGPVTGTWSLAGNTLRAQLISRQTKVSVSIGSISIPAPAGVASAVETLPPGEVFVTCSTDRLTMQLPTDQGGGTVTFDRA